MTRELYIECNTGISGDMAVAALLDLGADRVVLDEMLCSLRKQVGGFDTKISVVEKSGIMASDFLVLLDQDAHDHDMDYLYGHERGQTEMEHEHHSHHEQHHEHHHEHRSYKDIKEIIAATEMTEGARDVALRIFSIIAEAEGAVHGRPMDEVHFHEVGAVDSIVDILSAAVCLDSVKSKYGISDVIVTRLVDGTGTVRCQHGVIPVPVPAVVKIAEQSGVQISITDRTGEYVTPTGAAIAAAAMTKNVLPDSFRIIKIGIGAGKRDYVIPGMVRMMVIEKGD